MLRGFLLLMLLLLSMLANDCEPEDKQFVQD
jgi:hypothetical protein